MSSHDMPPPNDGSNTLPGWFNTCVIWSSDMVENCTISGHIPCWSMKLLGGAGGVSCIGSVDEGVVRLGFGARLGFEGPDVCKRC